MIKFGALSAGERDNDDEANKPEMDSMPTVRVYILFSLRFLPLINPYHFTGNTDVP